MVPPGAQLMMYEKTKPKIISIKPNKIDKSKVCLKPLFSWRAVATGMAIIEDITRIPIIRIDTDMVAPTKRAKI